MQIITTQHCLAINTKSLKTRFFGVEVLIGVDSEVLQNDHTAYI